METRGILIHKKEIEVVGCRGGKSNAMLSALQCVSRDSRDGQIADGTSILHIHIWLMIILHRELALDLVQSKRQGKSSSRMVVWCRHPPNFPSFSGRGARIFARARWLVSLALGRASVSNLEVRVGLTVMSRCRESSAR